jgi:hypothetical protein
MYAMTGDAISMRRDRSAGSRGRFRDSLATRDTGDGVIIVSSRVPSDDAATDAVDAVDALTPPPPPPRDILLRALIGLAPDGGGPVAIDTVV